MAAAEEIPLTVVVSRAAARADTDALEAAGVQVIVATGENEPARVRSGLEQLGALGVTAVLLEGGPHLAGAFLDAGEIDEIRLFLAPLLLGGSAARDPLEGKGVEQISEALRALTFDCERVGEDLLVSARLREWCVAIERAGAAMFTGLIADLGEVRGWTRRRGRDAADRHAAGGGAGRGRLDRGERRVPDRDRGARRELRGAGDARDAGALRAGRVGRSARG